MNDKIFMESIEFDSDIVSSVLYEGISEVLSAIIQYGVNSPEVKNNMYGNIILTASAIGMNLAGLYVLRLMMNSKTPSPKIYPTVGALFGLTCGILLFYSKGSNSGSIGTALSQRINHAVKDKKLNKVESAGVKVLTRILDFLLSKVGNLIISKLIKPFMKPAYIIMRPFYKLPQYVEAWSSVPVESGANKNGFVSFFTAFGCAMLASWSVSSIIGKNKNNSAPKKLYESEVSQDTYENKSLIKRKILLEAQELSNVSAAASLTPNLKLKGSKGIELLKKLRLDRNYLTERSVAKAKALGAFETNLDVLNRDFVLSSNNSANTTDQSKLAQYSELQDKVKALTKEAQVNVIKLHVNSKSKHDYVYQLKCIIKSLEAFVEAKSKAPNPIKVLNVYAMKFEDLPAGAVEYISIWNASVNLLTGQTHIMFENLTSPTNVITKSELAAVLTHEIGHYMTRQVVIIPIVGFVSVGSMISSLFINGMVLSLLHGSFNMYMNAIGRYYEIQADKYAAVRGYGQQLANALLKISNSKYNPNDTKDNNGIHSTINLRVQAILKYSN